MSIPTSIICRHKQTWFDSLSMDQLKDLCRAASLCNYTEDKTELDMVMLLCEDEISSTFASATVASIKDMCRSRSLPVSGLKYQLVLRVLSHDTIKTFSRTETMLSMTQVSQSLEEAIERDSNAFRWLEKEMEFIGYCNFISYKGANPINAFRDAETLFAVFMHYSTPNSGVDYHDSLSRAIVHLQLLVVEARVFLSKSEKKAAVEWISDVDNFLSEYMLDDNSQNLLDDVVELLKNDAYYLGGSSPKPKQNNKKILDSSEPPKRTPFRCLDNDAERGPNRSSNVSKAINDKKKPKPKVVTSKKEIVYKKMTKILRKRGKDSDYVYEKLVRLLKSILSQYDYYDSLRLFRSAFLALIVHFEKMEDPGIDTDHNFTNAIELLADVVDNVVGVLSTKQKDEVIRWMIDLQTITSPYGLGAMAEKPLCELISMVEESKAGEAETNTRRFFLPGVNY